ncbi:protein of unknown function [Candidatus Hydrogenisulfobacillus filiaventi]|uniref:Uncharacterized protein n=1 Tax=Candidatus Hydrogenisulfobacillus filiaventi TaxID=2707344 RepID=A0A6F8ZBX4_9FIRM|nr:protein of unknown function [Candidatus Hydrogenisulfobacillus filiaventi]
MSCHKPAPIPASSTVPAAHHQRRVRGGAGGRPVPRGRGFMRATPSGRTTPRARRHLLVRPVLDPIVCILQDCYQTAAKGA